MTNGNYRAACRRWCTGFTTILLLLSGCQTIPVMTDEQSRKASTINAELGASYLGRGQLDQARERLEKALQQNNKNAQAHVHYARLQQTIGDNDKAQDHFRTAIRLEPDTPEFHNSYGIFLCSQGDIEEAEKEFRLSAENPYYKTPEYALDNAGLCFLDNQRWKSAEHYLRQALRVNPRFPQALLHMAELVHQQQRLTVAEAYLMRFQEYSGETPRSLALAIQIRRDAGDAAGADQLARRLLRDFPESREAGEYLAKPLQN